MNRTRNLLWAALGTAFIGVGAIPAARVPILSDDFQALFESYRLADGSAWGALRYGWDAGTGAGHFNPVGQALGMLHHYSVYAVSSTLGTPPQLYDVLVGTALIWATVAAATAVLVQGLRLAGATPRLEFWRAFALLAAVTAATLQLHPWTNDPVTTYLLAGWGSAVIGFGLLALALRAGLAERRGWADVALVGALAVVAVVYYEMLVGIIAGTAVVYLAVLLRGLRARDRATWLRGAALLGAGVVLPALVFLAGRLLAVPAEESAYTGTTVSLGPDALSTWWAAMVGAVPAGGWEFLVESGGGTIPHTRASTLLTVVFVGLALILVAAWRRGPVVTARWSRAVLVPIGAVAVAWGATTATQATTQKYIDEIDVPGQVYLYYAVGVVCVAVLLAGAAVTVLPRLGSTVKIGAVLVAGAFLAVQVPLNWNLATISENAYTANRNLSTAGADDSVDPQVRCDTLLDWAQHPWPEYYRDAIVDGVQEDFERVFDEPFCSDRAVLRQLERLSQP